MMKQLHLSIRVLALALLFGCGNNEPDVSITAAVAPIDVWSIPVLEETIVEPIIGTGSIAAHKTSNIGPRVDGIIDEIYVRVGDHVESGAPLFRSREIDFRIRVDEANHALRLASAEAEKAARDKKRIDEKEDGKGDARIRQVADVYRAPATAKRRLH